jgi:hypothetical protein
VRRFEHYDGAGDFCNGVKAMAQDFSDMIRYALVATYEAYSAL